MKRLLLLLGILFLVTGCSSHSKAEVPKDAKPGPTVIPTVRDAGAGFKPN